MTRKYFYNNRLRYAIPFAAASFTVGLALFACSDKDIDSNENNGKALVAFNVSEKQDEAQAAAKANQPVTRAAFANQLALQDLAPEDLTMQKLPVQGMASQGLCLIETTVAGVPSQREDETPTRANITTMTTMQNFSTTAFYGSSDTSLEPWFYDKDTKKDGNLVTPIYWDWFKNHGCFYAVYPKPYSKLQLSPSTYAGTPYVDFEVEPNVKNQKDLMTACSGNVHTDIGAMSATTPRTDLTFRHALTAVRFKVGQNLSWNKTITKVEIIGAKSKGRYTLPTDKTVTGAWNPTSLSTPATFTLGGDGTVSVSTSAAVNNVIMGNSGDNFVFYMIPQPLTGVQVKVFFSDGSTPITATLTGQWKPGTTKTYALSQNTSDWSYVLNVVGPTTPAAYNQTAAGNYTIQSYRKDPATSVLQKVAWKVVGYSMDNGLTWSDNKPAWLTGLTKENGEGSTAPSGETGQATLKLDIVDKLTPRNNALRAATAKGSASNYYDLSTHDVEGNPTPRNTANCYVISAPGYYKIPLVYGNAIKNGTDNTSAYISTTIPATTVNNSSSFGLLHNFQDHASQDITTPWITLNNSGANAPDAAHVVWADENGLVTNLSVTGSGTNGFVNFEVPASAIKSGNAVIAVTKGGTVVWSWHLWFTTQDALHTIACTNASNRVNKFTTENLGWKYTVWNSSTFSAPRKVKVKVEQTVANGGVKQSAYITITQNNGAQREGYSTLYQWGRKDAMPGKDGVVVQGSFSFNAGVHGVPIGYAIQHPENILNCRQNSSNWNYWNWCYYNYYNFWSVNNTSIYHVIDPIDKTIYDPCPVGFEMPAGDAFTGFTATGNNTSTQSEFNINGGWDNGWHFNNKTANPDATIYFPVTGYRASATMAAPTEGCYWMASPDANDGAGFMHFSSGAVSPWERTARYLGAAVRPVAE